MPKENAKWKWIGESRRGRRRSVSVEAGRRGTERRGTLLPTAFVCPPRSTTSRKPGTFPGPSLDSEWATRRSRWRPSEQRVTRWKCSAARSGRRSCPGSTASFQRRRQARSLPQSCPRRRRSRTATCPRCTRTTRTRTDAFNVSLFLLLLAGSWNSPRFQATIFMVHLFLNNYWIDIML